jgi:hypothetical protein
MGLGFSKLIVGSFFNLSCFAGMSGTDSIACKFCKALIDCPKEEADKFIKSFSEHILGNSSAITALDLCHPCLNEARKSAPVEPARIVWQGSSPV